MYRHTPSILRGPVSRTRTWWKSPTHAADELRRLRPPTLAHAQGLMEVGIRTDLVSRVRRDIAEGRYDTPEMWDAALERLLARLGRP